MNRQLSTIIRLGATAALLSALAGCDSTGKARYTTDADVARQSLETALTAWRDGRPCGRIEGPSPIQVSDARWREGEPISAFEIGDQHDDGDGFRQFPVKLTLKKSGKVEDARYIVHGRDPVWIYSEADYKRMIDMGNSAEPARPRVPRRGGR